MNKASVRSLASILEVSPSALSLLEKKMSEVTGKQEVLEKVLGENQSQINLVLKEINSSPRDANQIRGAMRQIIVNHEKQLMEILEGVEAEDEFAKSAVLAKRMAKNDKGFFLKKDHLKSILTDFPPYNLMQYLGYGNINELVAKEDLTECFSALRFVESNKWMHELFQKVYGRFTPKDFEERPVELKVLGPKWYGIAKKFVEKKHHNVSHLKEFGVIFLNPIREDIPGKLLRDFAVLLHYFHEISFYSELFRKYSRGDNFSERLKSLLRGDVKEVVKVEEGEWLIVQRYLNKENPEDARLKLPRVNPESIHWVRGEEDLARYARGVGYPEMAWWSGLDWVGGIFKNVNTGEEELLSFDLEDNAMSLVSFMEGGHDFFIYHQREAMWTKIFSEYAGGEKAAEKLVVENFEKGIVKFV